ncbi:hypothetical protein F7725_006164 [Dissostichus mawsoni]|uniref:Uncharacterized protein n=1 Tax=Dissostichus mawsoni TaxID=36200 RepID=A0A7J5YVP4_DISMA|nr:hypothetical protein F7725_006164 [Dissostichus mawsoni]
MSSPVTVSISIIDFSKTTMLLQDSVTLNLENGYHTLKTLQLSSNGLEREEKKNKFVHLKVDFVGHHSMEKILMVVFTSSPTFKAFNSSVTIDIQNPDGVVVKQVSRIQAFDGVFGDTFPLSEIVNEGQWTVIAKFDHWEQNTFTSQFQVKKYVLPAFNVTLTPRKSFLDLDDTELEVEIWARYLYGEPVQGTAYVVFGVKINQEMRRLPAVKQVTDLNGGVVKLSMEEIKRAHPNIRSLVGSSVYVKASVLTKSGQHLMSESSDLVEAEKTGIKIVESLYAISFKDPPKYFKPGLPLDFTVRTIFCVYDHFAKTGLWFLCSKMKHHKWILCVLGQNFGGKLYSQRNVIVKVTFLDTPLVVSSGTTRATVNMPPQQRAQTITPFATFRSLKQNYLHISTGTNTVSLGDRLSLKMSITVADPTYRQHITQITYMVLNKGKIIVAERVDVAGQLITGIDLHVTRR